MDKSTELNALASALAKAQSEIKDAIKNSQNPHFRSKFADLSSVWDACREALNRNGLSVSQTVKTDNGAIFLESTLLHSSGQYLTGSMPLLLNRQDMQQMGSALSYARRYSLAALVGVTQDDDDGEIAVGRTQKVSSSPTKTFRQLSEEVQAAKESDFDAVTTNPTIPSENDSLVPTINNNNIGAPPTWVTEQEEPINENKENWSDNTYCFTTIKKFKGQEIDTIPITELQSYYDWAAKNLKPPIGRGMTSELNIIKDYISYKNNRLGGV